MLKTIMYAIKSTKISIEEIEPREPGHHYKVRWYCREKNQAREILKLLEYEIVPTKSNNF